MEPEAAEVHRTRHAVERGGLLGHADDAGMVMTDGPIQLLEKIDGFEILATAKLIRRPFTGLARVVEINHRSDRIHAQTVDVILLDPEQRIGDQKIANFMAAVVE